MTKGSEANKRKQIAMENEPMTLSKQFFKKNYDSPLVVGYVQSPKVHLPQLQIQSQGCCWNSNG